MALLTLDAGNTYTKAVLFEQDRPIKEAKWQHLTLEALQRWLLPHRPQACLLAVSGSIPESDVLKFLHTLRFYQLSAHLPLPITLHYDTPHSLGADRIAGAVGAYICAGQQSVLKIDCGTCTTYDFVSRGGVFEGGIITPGLRMRARAMHAYTARLPEVTIPDSVELIGKSTTTALQSGVLNGWQLEIEGFVNRFVQTRCIGSVVVTGGDMHHFPEVAISVVKQPLLVHIGLHHILQHLISLNHPAS